MLKRPDLASNCDLLRASQRDRKFIIATQVALENRAAAHITGSLNLLANASEAERKKIWNRAKHIVAVEVGTCKAVTNRKTKQVTLEIVRGTHHEEDLALATKESMNLTVVREAVAPILKRRFEIEAEMERLAAELPVAHTFLPTVKGFGPKGLAVIVGEAGNLSNYATKRRLWRRLGLGMAPGHEEHAYSTWRKKGGLSADEWKEAGYCPKRLGQVFGVVTEQLIKWKAHNPYGAVYEARRLHTMQTHPEWWVDAKTGKPKLDADGMPRSAHGHMDAARVMTKTLLADLLAAWHAADDAVYLQAAE